MAGVLRSTDGLPTAPPQRFGTLCQSSRRLGLMVQAVPITAPVIAMAAVAIKSGGVCMRSDASAIRARYGSGMIAVGNGSTGASSALIGLGSDHSSALA